MVKESCQAFHRISLPVSHWQLSKIVFVISILILGISLLNKMAMSYLFQSHLKYSSSIVTFCIKQDILYFIYLDLLAVLLITYFLKCLFLHCGFVFSQKLKHFYPKKSPIKNNNKKNATPHKQNAVHSLLFKMTGVYCTQTQLHVHKMKV